MTAIGVGTVRTTGIYCRASCSARPHPSNTGTAPSPVAAEVAGYRACLRCRSDHLPVAPVSATTDPLVATALDRIAAGFLDDGTESDLAAEVGFSARHLRRLFREHVGATPSQVAASRRAHFARMLLDDTDLSVTDIAFTSGFGSVRRMNEVVRSTFAFSPTELRAKRRVRPIDAADGGLRLQLLGQDTERFRDQLRWLRSRSIPGVVSITDAAYRRSIRTCGHGGVVEVAARRAGRLEVVAHLPSLSGLMDLVARVRYVFRLDHVDDHLPMHWSQAEGDVVTWAEGEHGDTSELLGDWIAEHGESFPGVERLGLTHLFPSQG